VEALTAAKSGKRKSNPGPLHECFRSNAGKLDFPRFSEDALASGSLRWNMDIADDAGVRVRH
jgi:uncharacterized protein YbcV (DUF1398 family)